MGLFFNYDKPGKGIDKDAPKKKGPFLYLELLWRKLGLLLTSNMLYFLVSLPVLFIYFVFSGAVVSSLFKIDALSPAFAQLTLILTSLIAILLGTGPVSCGYTYLLRNFAREEHVFMVSDFFQKIKENFKAGLFILVLDIAVLFLSANALLFYSSLYSAGHSYAIFLLTIMCMFIAVYIFAHFYFFQFTVTFENKIRTNLKNAFIMAIASMPMNIFLIAFVSILTYLLFAILTPFAILLVMFIFWISSMRFPIDFYAARVIKKKLIDINAPEESDE